ncbi:MAG: ABC transporter permease [Oscillospiraceae bacterium]|nr:ABC transporter permease [Oscillospiraceae bacterium]
MKLKLPKFKIILSVLNIVCIVFIIVFNSLSAKQINGLTSQRGAEKWQNGNDLNYSHISCFFAKDSGMDINTVNSIKNEIKNAMVTASLQEEEGSRLWIDAYTSSLGKLEVLGTKRGTARTEITAVTSDFFLIHDFQFIDGSYFREEEISQNGIVIDSMLAWQIFGSDNVKGMTAEINNISFYVAGVVKNPENSAEKKTYGSFPRAYISYQGAESLFKNVSSSSLASATASSVSPVNSESITVDSYEAVIPNPVKKFAYNTLSEFIGNQYENTSYTLENSDRFGFSKSFKRLRHLSNSVVINNAVEYPWWENSARVTEVKVSLNLFAIVVFSIIPIITLLIIFIKLFKYIASMHIIKRLIEKIKSKIPY